MTLDLGDLLGATIGSIALVVTAITFKISYTEASQSEQIKTSRDLWAGIFEKMRKIIKIKDDEKVQSVVLEQLWPLFWEIDYFAHLILRGEIKDKTVLDYYTYTISALASLTDPADWKHVHSTFSNLIGLIEKWDIDVST